jgi:hypothetical protein
MHFRRIVPLLIALAAAVTPAAAGAATVTTTVTTSTGPHDETYDNVTIAFEAAPGERNLVTVRTERNPVPGTSFSYPAFVVADTGGAPLTAGDGCAVQADASVRCAPKGGDSFAFTADLGDGDDRVTVLDPEGGSGGSFGLDGGPGDDVLDASATGDATDVHFDGGEGDDKELGGAGPSDFTGDPGHDRIAGGPGAYDSLDYERRSDPIRATLGPAQAGDEDDISGVESLQGGRGDDHLTGSDGPDAIQGGGGHDVIDGRGGDDRLDDTSYELRDVARAEIDGGAGNDTIRLDGASRAYGGPGDDEIYGGSRAWVAGGPGRDALTGGRVTADDDGADADFVTCVRPRGAPSVLGAGDVSIGCGGHLRRSGGRPHALAIYGPEPVDLTTEDWRSSTLTLWCTDEASRGGCAARVSIRDAQGRVVARRRAAARRGHAREIYFAYNKTFARRLRQKDALTVTIVATVAGRTVRLRRCAQAEGSLDHAPRRCG